MKHMPSQALFAAQREEHEKLCVTLEILTKKVRARLDYFQGQLYALTQMGVIADSALYAQFLHRKAELLSKLILYSAMLKSTLAADKSIGEQIVEFCKVFEQYALEIDQLLTPAHESIRLPVKARPWWKFW